MKEVILIHHRAIAIYPPIINLTRFFSEQKGIKVILFSTSFANAPVFNQHVEMGRKSYSSTGLGSLQFYFDVFRKLVEKPQVPVFYFESLSSLPVWLYLKVFRRSKRKTLAHFHEFFSAGDYLRQSFWEKNGRRLEGKIFHKLSWISHTNSDRLSFFKKEFPHLESSKLHVLPNFPPSAWQVEQPMAKSGSLKFVYVGSLSFETIYVKEFVAWLNSISASATCDFYSLNANVEMIDYLKNQSRNVAYKGPLSYEDLPKILPQYHIGLIMYRGLSKNVIFSAPNKLFEYLACGLDVWCSSELISSKPYSLTETFPKVIMVDFTKLNEFDYESALDRQGLTFKPSPYRMEPVLENLFQVLNQE